MSNKNSIFNRVTGIIKKGDNPILLNMRYQDFVCSLLWNIRQYSKLPTGYRLVIEQRDENSEIRMIDSNDPDKNWLYVYREKIPMDEPKKGSIRIIDIAKVY